MTLFRISDDLKFVDENNLLSENNLMRSFELIILLIVTVLPFTTKNLSKYIRPLYILLILGILLSFHLTLEKWRWQMIPSYLFTLVLAWCHYRKCSFFHGSLLRKIGSGFALTIGLLFAWSLPYILPVFNLPSPTGTYQIGSEYLHLKTDRQEEITEYTDDKRELMIKVWYPASVNNEETEAYLNDGDRFGFAEKYGLPESTFNYLNNVETHTYKSPDVADGKFPILIFSHGSYSNAYGYYAILEEIVSRGYIVLNINHTYESTGTLFPDGAIKFYSNEYDKKYISTQKMTEMAWKSHQAFNSSKTESEKLLVSRDILKIT